MKLSIALCCKVKHTRPEKTTLTHKFGKKNGRLGRTFLRAMSEIELWTLSSLSSDSACIASASLFLQTIKAEEFHLRSMSSSRCIQFVGIFWAWISSFLSSNSLSLASRATSPIWRRSPSCCVQNALFAGRRCTAGRTYITVYGARVHILTSFTRAAFFLSMRRIFSSTSSTGRVVIWKNWVAEVKKEGKTIKGICHNIA